MKAEVNRIVYAINSEDVDVNITQEVAISDEFDSVSELREVMKEKGYARYDYQVVYSYEIWVSDRHLGTGRGLTDAEAKKDLESDVNMGYGATVAMIKTNPQRYFY